MLAVGGYYVVDSSPSTTVDSAPVQSAVVSASTDQASPSVTTFNVAVELAPTDPTRGGTVRVGVVGHPGTMNPLLTGSDRSLLAVHHLVGASALRLDPTTHDLTPGVFGTVPTIGSGGLTVNVDGSMTVRGEISPLSFWSDGTAMTGADFARTYDIVMTHREVIHPAIVASYDRMVPGSLAVDASSVEFTLSSPTLRLDDLFSVLIPAHQVDVESFISSWDDRMWASGGPFMFDGSDGSTLRFVANPVFGRLDQHGVALPYLDSIEVDLFESTEAAVSALGNGSIDVVGPIESYMTTTALDDLPGVSVDVLGGPGWEQIAFQFGPGAADVNPASVADRAAIRRAVFGALDRTAIAAEVQGRYGTAIESIVAIGWPSAGASVWDDSEVDGGQLTGVMIVLATTGGDETRSAVVNLVIEQLGNAGAEVHLVTDEPGRFFGELVLPGAFEVAEWAWVSSPGSDNAADDVLNWFTADGAQALDFSQWSSYGESGEFAGLATGLGSILSSDELRQRLVVVERAIAVEVPLIPLFADLNVGAAWDRVRGYQHSALPGGVLATAADWWVLEE